MFCKSRDKKVIIVFKTNRKMKKHIILLNIYQYIYYILRFRISFMYHDKKKMCTCVMMMTMMIIIVIIIFKLML